MNRRLILKTALAASALLTCAGSLMLSAVAQDAEITAANWGEAVGFKPDLSVLKVAPGTTIHKGNVTQVKAMLPPGLETLVRKYELKMKITPYGPVHPSKGYIETTQRNRGKAKAWDVGKNYRTPGWKGYEGGLPFPKPKNGLEVAYNFLNTYTADDVDRYYDVSWVSAKRGVENTEYWHWTSLRTANRTDLDPRPNVASFEKDRIRWASLTFALEPYDKRGFGALYFTSLDPKDLTGHVYVPSMRRVLRHSFGTRGDSWNATDFLYEDVGGYLGAAEWMNWKIVDRKTMLLPINSGIVYGKGSKSVYDVDHWPHWNPKINWQARPVFVLEAKPKLPDYPYSRMLLLVDAETYTVPYKEAYDKKGELWKIVLGGGTDGAGNANAMPIKPGFGVAIDLQAQHASLVSFRKVEMNTKLNPSEFSVSSLKRKAH